MRDHFLLGDHDGHRTRPEALPAYSAGTDTLYLEFHPSEVVEIAGLGDNTLVEFDAGGHRCAITVEHARDRAVLPHLTFEQVAA